jgi:hypothetical protein
MSNTGVISGIPTVAGVFSGTITASNGTAPNATQSFSITIAQAIMFTSAAPPSTGNVGTAYNHACTVIGTAPLAFAAPNLPTGLTINSIGVISGTPTATGTFTGTITASNGGLATPVTQGFSIVISPAVTYTAGSASLTVTLGPLGGPEHDAVVWVATATGTFIKTLWKQGPAAFDDIDWVEHFNEWNIARNGSTALDLDGFTSATALTYSPPNSPIVLNWNGKDASNNLLPDGDYKFWVQYAENNDLEGPFTTNGLQWTKGTSVSPVNPTVQGTNFTDMHIVWTPTVVDTPLQAWRLTNFGNNANSGEGADLSDYDKDGIQNLLEFGFDLDPTKNSAGMLPQPQKSGNFFVISFTQPVGVSGVTYGAEWSQTLLSGNWTAVTDTGVFPQHTFSVPIDTKTKLFMRLKVMNPNP